MQSTGTFTACFGATHLKNIYDIDFYQHCAALRLTCSTIPNGSIGAPRKIDSTECQARKTDSILYLMKYQAHQQMNKDSTWNWVRERIWVMLGLIFVVVVCTWKYMDDALLDARVRIGYKGRYDHGANRIRVSIMVEKEKMVCSV